MGDEETGVLEGVGYTLLGVLMFSFLGLIAYRNRDNGSFFTGILPILTTGVAFLANILPFSILAYGVAGDIINQEFRLSIPSIASILSILTIGIGTQYLAKTNGADLSQQDTSGTWWCTIPGLESAESPYFPTAFISTTIIGFYYLCWAWHTSRPWKSILLSFLLVWVIQFSSFVFGECSMSYKPISGSIFYNLVISALIGIVIGAISFGSASWNQTYNPYNLPGGSPNAATGGSPPAKLSKCPDGSVPIDGKCPYRTGHSQPVQNGGDENTFVAELYKNGQLVTDSIAA